MVNTGDFDFFLPEDRIAAFPATRRDESRLLRLDRADGRTIHTVFRHIGEHLPKGALIVLNDTRVIPARLRGRKPTGGAVELLLTRRMGSEADASEMDWEALGRNLGWAAVGTILTFAGGREAEGAAPGAMSQNNAQGSHEQSTLTAQIKRRGAAGAVEVRLRAPAGQTVMEVLEQVGELPLPPYIEVARRKEAGGAAELARLGDLAGERAAADSARTLDRDRYQTVFATSRGAVAAPTAGLHFTDELLNRLRAAGHQIVTLTLHVGVGTFRPVKVDRLEDHAMESETYTISQGTARAVNEARRAGRPVVAVGTTVVRALESSARENRTGRESAGDPGAADVVSAGTSASRLFLRPGEPFHVVTDLVTNFHLPRSTLLMLVSAFAGRERVLAAYAEAIEAGYRFYSYGDAMLIRGTP